DQSHSQRLTKHQVSSSSILLKHRIFHFANGLLLRIQHIKVHYLFTGEGMQQLVILDYK
ncbi:hypothetical protein S83_012050, partial [Arachis hypogaea]